MCTILNDAVTLSFWARNDSLKWLIVLTLRYNHGKINECADPEVGS